MQNETGSYSNILMKVYLTKQTKAEKSVWEYALFLCERVRVKVWGQLQQFQNLLLLLI